MGYATRLVYHAARPMYNTKRPIYPAAMPMYHTPRPFHDAARPMQVPYNRAYLPRS